VFPACALRKESHVVGCASDELPTDPTRAEGVHVGPEWVRVKLVVAARAPLLGRRRRTDRGLSFRPSPRPHIALVLEYSRRALTRGARVSPSGAARRWSIGQPPGDRKHLNQTPRSTSADALKTATAPETAISAIALDDEQ
jgi:hypothetical protein